MQSSLLRSADAVLVLSDRIADELVASGVPGSRVRVVPLGIGRGTDRTLPRPESMDGRRWIVYAGRLVREKGVRDLVAAFGALTADDAGLVIVGDGPDRPALEAAARGLASGHRVRFVGAVSNTRVGAYLRHADLVVLPSWYEERGRVLLEAMAVGTPVVATRTGGIPASVQDGLNGALVPPRDPRRLAAAIDRLLGDEELAASMATAGRATASEHGIGALADAMLAAYAEVRGRVAERRGAEISSVSAP